MLEQQYYQKITPARISWSEGVPYSLDFDDIYFNEESGLDESKYVFFEQNDLFKRWENIESDFVIAETGFGTGLNFLIASQLWLEKNKDNILHFVSVDKHPLTKSDLKKSLDLWPEFSEIGEEFLKYYPEIAPGWQQICLLNGRVILTLFFGDVENFLEQANFVADAWFLDGFAPSKNKGMWSTGLYKNIARLSAKGTSFSTFTSAGDVRRGLIKAGFTVIKAKGYKWKRELIKGLFENHSLNTDGLYPVSDQPWFMHRRMPHEKCIAIIGAGLAGAFTANTFAQRGYKVTVIDSASGPAQKASGNKQALIYCRFSAYPSPQYDFYHQAYLRSVNVLQDFSYVYQKGLLDLSFDSKSRERFAHLESSSVWDSHVMQFVGSEQASLLTGIDVQKGGVFMPNGGYVNPAALCENLLKHKNIELKFNCEITGIEKQNDEWQLLDENSQLQHKSKILIIATAYSSLDFDCLKHMPLKNIRGQVSHLAASNESKALKIPICYEGYIAPAENGIHSVGASFNLHESTEETRVEDYADNLSKLNNRLSISLGKNENDVLNYTQDRVGFRCHAPDYLPVVGPVADIQFYRNRYNDLGKGKLKKTYPVNMLEDGLFVNLAHGSRGVVSAPLCAEILFSYINEKTVFPVSEAIRTALHPARFIIKALKQRKEIN